MNITAYAELASTRRSAAGFNDHHVIDDAASVGKRHPVVIAHVQVIRGFGHITGERRTHMEGLSAVVRLGPANSLEPVLEALRTGLVNGRDDRSYR